MSFIGMVNKNKSHAEIAAQRQREHLMASSSSEDKQQWCTACLKQVEDPVKLDCGHIFCGEGSNRKCAETAKWQQKCPVAKCGVQFAQNFGTQKTDENLSQNFPSTSQSSKQPETVTEEEFLIPPNKSKELGFLVDDVRGNGRKKLLIIGKTGTGKSTLCNVISGLEHNSNFFPVSEKPDSCTQSTQFGDVFFAGNIENPITVIDTIGFQDSRNEQDARTISELVVKLRNLCDHVNLFAIAVNGQNPRLDGALVGMIRIFEGMFGGQFWNQAVIIFTRLPMDLRSRNVRITATGSTDDKIAADYLKKVESKFPEGKGLKYLLMDALYVRESREESGMFNLAMTDLWKLLSEAPKLQTQRITIVESDTEMLKRLIHEHEKKLAEIQTLREIDREDMKRERSAFEAKVARNVDEIEKKHQQELKELKESYSHRLDEIMSDRTKMKEFYENKENQLRKEYELKLKQSKQELEELKTKYEAEKKEKEKLFEQEMSKLKASIDSLEKMVDQQGKLINQQGKTNEDLLKEINDLKDKQRVLKETHERQMKELEEQFQTQENRIKKDIQFLTEKYQSEIGKFQTQRSLGEKVSSISNNLGNEPEPSAKDEWMILASDTFHSTQGSIDNKCTATSKKLEKKHPNSHWAVFVFDYGIDLDWKAISKGGEDALKKGVEEDAEWGFLTITTAGGQNLVVTLYIWRALKSHCNIVTEVKTDKKEKVKAIIKNLEANQKKEPEEMKWNLEKWRDNLVEKLNKDAVQWKHLILADSFLHFSPLYSFFPLHNKKYVCICFC